MLDRSKLWNEKSKMQNQNCSGNYCADGSVRFKNLQVLLVLIYRKMHAVLIMRYATDTQVLHPSNIDLICCLVCFHMKCKTESGH